MGQNYYDMEFLCFELGKVCSTLEESGVGDTKPLQAIREMMNSKRTRDQRQICPWDNEDKLSSAFIAQVATLLAGYVRRPIFEIDADSEEFGLLNPSTFYLSSWQTKEQWFFAVTNPLYDELETVDWPKSLGKLQTVEFGYQLMTPPSRYAMSDEGIIEMLENISYHVADITASDISYIIADIKSGVWDK